MDSQYCYPKPRTPIWKSASSAGGGPSSAGSELRFVMRVRRNPPTFGCYPLGWRALPNNGEDTRVYNGTHYKRECAPTTGTRAWLFGSTTDWLSLRSSD